jgi:hypothetical protein
MNRRGLLSALGAGSLFNAACSDSTFGGGSAQKAKNRGDSIDDEGGDTDKEGTENGLEFGQKGDGGGLGDGGSDSCHANTTNTVDLEAFSEAESDFKPTIKFYGKNTEKSDTVMIAMKFADITKIDQIIISKDDGALVAIHGITAGDKDGIVIVDNLYLKGSEKVQILLQAGADRFKSEHPISFFDTFDGMPVEDLGTTTFSGQQSVVQFDATGTEENKSLKYPNLDGSAFDRFLDTAQAATSWTKTPNVKGTVTDIMGEAFSVDGKGLQKQQTFCTYVESGGKMFRTILRVG